MNFCISKKAGRREAHVPIPHSQAEQVSAPSGTAAGAPAWAVHAPQTPSASHQVGHLSPGWDTAPGCWLIKHQAFPWDAAGLTS